MTVIAQTGLKNILNIQIVNLRRPGNRNIFVELCIALDFQNHIVIRIARSFGFCTNSNFTLQIRSPRNLQISIDCRISVCVDFKMFTSCGQFANDFRTPGFQPFGYLQL